MGYNKVWSVSKELGMGNVCSMARYIFYRRHVNELRLKARVEQEVTGRGQTAEARRTTILQPVEQKPHSQKDRQDEKAEGYVPDEGTR